MRQFWLPILKGSLVVMLLATSSALSAKYWNQLFDLGGNSELDPNLLVVDSHAYVIHTYDSPQHNGALVTSINKFDFQGNRIWSREFAEQGYAIYRNMGPTVQDSTLFFTLFRFKNKVYDTLHYLVKMGFDGDTLLLKPLISSHPHRYISSHLLPDQSMVLTGYAIDSAEVTHWVFHKLDSAGQTIWYREFPWKDGYVNTNTGHDIALTPDGGFALSGASDGYDTTKLTQGMLVKTDSLGQVEWVKDYGGKEGHDHAFYVTVVDSFILTSGRIIIQASSTGDPYAGIMKIFLGKYHLDGRVVFEKLVGPNTGNFVSMRDITTLSNGDILLSGGVQDISFFPTGLLFRLTSTGDSIWYRYHDYLFGLQNRHIIESAAELPDGSILTAGQCRPSSIHWDSVPPALWMMRLDSLGCHFPGCDTVCVKPEVEYEIEILPDLRVRAINKTKNALLSFMTLREPDVAWNGSDSFEVTYQMASPGICGLSIVMEGPCNIPFRFDTTFYVGYVGTPGIEGAVPIQLYPNPATDQFTLQWEAPLPQGTLTLYDLQGKAILRQAIRQSNTLINVSGLSSALYIAALQDANGAVLWRGKVMVE